jgi:hypothetical protein
MKKRWVKEKYGQPVITSPFGGPNTFIKCKLKKPVKNWK